MTARLRGSGGLRGPRRGVRGAAPPGLRPKARSVEGRRPTLAVMVKEPRPGRVKTRLGREIGAVEAAWWFRRQSAALLRRLRDPRWRLVVAVSPDAAGMRSRVWPADLPRVAQGPGDLGQRMGRLLRSLPPGPVCVVGADIPGLGRAHAAEAFRALGRHDAVLGPAEDGGYWLIGLRRTAAVPATLFRGVRWSTPDAMADTAGSMPGLRIARAATLLDVDTADDLRRAGSGGSAHPIGAAPGSRRGWRSGDAGSKAAPQASRRVGANPPRPC